jgi:Tat protein secretion system quality control protein TatD with DNase activity
MLIDTHAHVNFHAFLDDAKEVLQRALDSGVWVINVGSQIDTSRQCVELANQFASGVYAVVGLHPEHTHSQVVDEEETHFQTREEVFDYEMYKKLAQDPKVVGIGECGLDYFRIKNEELGIENVESIKQKQKNAFRAQVQLAKELNKVLVIHSRSEKGNEELFDDLLTILDEEGNLSAPLMHSGHLPSPLDRLGVTMSSIEGSRGENPVGVHDTGKTAEPPSPFEGRVGERLQFEVHSFTHSTPAKASAQGKTMNLRFEIHSFTGSPEYLQKFLDRGGFVSFNGIITFDKTGNMEKLVRMTPLDKIILETDCPFLTPPPNRGKRNEPSFVRFVAEKVAQTKGLSFDDIAEATTNNAKKLFSI